jgi:hypothetical protein
MTPAVVLATELPGAGGGVATAAAIAVAAASEADEAGRGVVLVEVGGSPRRPTLLASAAARNLEERLADVGLSAAARGHLAWVALDGDDWLDRLGDALDPASDAAAVVVHLPPSAVRRALASDRVGAAAVAIRADIPRQGALAALAVGELRAGGIRVRVLGRAPGRVGARRAIAGIDPGGDLQRAATRAARRLVGATDSRYRPAGIAQPRSA